MTRPLLTGLFAALLALALSAGPAMAQPGQTLTPPDLTPEELANFKAVLRPARFDDTDDKIELAVVFWYGCGACRESDSTTALFLNSLSDDIRPIRLPALFSGRAPFQTHGRLYLVLDELGVEGQARKAAFDTAQQVNNPNRRGYGLTTKESQATFAVSQGVSRAAFDAAYDSTAVTGREARVKAFLDNSGIDAVPGMIINGRYVITFYQGNYYQLAEKLINHERARLAQAKAGAPEAGKAEAEAAGVADALEGAIEGADADDGK
ncbi:MAG: thiol:disulfide interchange protein DsbA/DsbL [Deltaproteobacteria bacterium]|jgi:thiol:disulfide interchange protein DsbA|nr:thiol:disulfide interchange protein DsbA/DsbL [Deltaproteobacteria bacterium]